jgi:hypothetical protein
MATVPDQGRGVGVFDNLLMFISSGNVTKTGTHPTSGIKLRGTPVRGLAARILFPSSPGLSATILPEIHVSADDSTYRVQATYAGGALSWAAGADTALGISQSDREVMVPFEVPTGFPYVKLKLTVTGGSTATSFGAVKAGIVPRAHGDWTRQVRWD